MSRKLVVIGLAVVLAITILLFTTYGPRESGNDFELFKQALEGRTSATCTFSGSDDTEIEESVYYFENGHLRIADSYADDNIISNTLVINDLVYTWEDESPDGAVYVFEGSLSEYIGIVMVDEDEARQNFEETQSTCARGAPDELFEVPEDINFTDGSTDPAPL